VILVGEALRAVRDAPHLAVERRGGVLRGEREPGLHLLG
jgi:hypothetical protein